MAPQLLVILIVILILILLVVPQNDLGADAKAVAFGNS
jgi:preprotein translocase subunit SecG